MSLIRTKICFGMMHRPHAQCVLATGHVCLVFSKFLESSSIIGYLICSVCSQRSTSSALIQLIDGIPSPIDNKDHYHHHHHRHRHQSLFIHETDKQ